MLKRLGSLAIVVIMISILCYSNVIQAAPLQSTNYRFDESSIGVETLQQSDSTNYQTSSATNNLTVGNSSSSSYQVESGTQTTSDPTLAFYISSAPVNFGSFTATAATTATTTFSVSNYTSYGYVVQIIGGAPSNGSHTIDAMSVLEPSQPGTEQFGINLVANTSPISFGANPDNGQFGYGTVATEYNSANEFKYVSGDIIASSPKSSGVTNYTISYIVNVDSLTLGGQYTSNQTIIVTGTY